MKLISIISLLAAAVTAMPVEDNMSITEVTATASNVNALMKRGNTCYRKDHVLFFHYEIDAEGIENGSDVCRDLHNAVKGQYCAPTKKGCTWDPNTKHLHWWFNDSRYCSSDMVEHAWWQVTHNDHGEIHC